MQSVNETGDGTMTTILLTVVTHCIMHHLQWYGPGNPTLIESVVLVNCKGRTGVHM